jgi:hypothetical protein
LSVSPKSQEDASIYDVITYESNVMQFWAEEIDLKAMIQISKEVGDLNIVEVV